PEITQSGRSGSSFSSAKSTASVGVPDTDQCRGSTCVTRNGWVRVSEWPDALRSRSGATTSRCPSPSSARSSAAKPAARIPSSFVSRNRTRAAPGPQGRDRFQVDSSPIAPTLRRGPVSTSKRRLPKEAAGDKPKETYRVACGMNVTRLVAVHARDRHVSEPRAGARGAHEKLRLQHEAARCEAQRTDGPQRVQP